MLITSPCIFRKRLAIGLNLLLPKIHLLDIKAYIRELLFVHDCVIIPGFGGFICNFSPSRVDMVTGTLFPPLKQITFNRNLNHNDGLLISKISLARKINYGDARHTVEEFVRILRDQLDRGEKVVFDHLGTFRYNRENSIQFEPEPNINYYPGSYGLESFQYIPAKEYDVRKRVLRHIDREPVTFSSARKNLWRAAVIIPVLALLIAVPLKTDLLKSRIESTTLNPLATVEIENNRKAVDEAAGKIEIKLPSDSVTTISEPDTSVPASQPAAPPPSENLRPATPETAAITAKPLASKGLYCVITGSFKSEENALSHVNSLKENGFNPEISQAPNGFYRVTAKVCSDMESAVATRDSIIKEFPGSWISRK